MINTRRYSRKIINGKIYLEVKIHKRIHSEEMHILRGDDQYENVDDRIHSLKTIDTRIHSEEMHILRGDDQYENVFWEDD